MKSYYIYINEGRPIFKTVKIGQDVYADITADGSVVGIEILNVESDIAMTVDGKRFHVS